MARGLDGGTRIHLLDRAPLSWGCRLREAVLGRAMVAFGGSGGVRMMAPSAAGGPGGGEPVPSVLWIPDDDVRLLLRGILTLHHHPVTLELSSAEALRRWEAPPVALLIVDAVSGADRWREELAEALRTRPELRAIVLLPRDRESLRREAESLGARVTLVRPFAVRDLVAAIHEALHGSPVLADG